MRASTGMVVSRGLWREHRRCMNLRIPAQHPVLCSFSDTKQDPAPTPVSHVPAHGLVGTYLPIYFELSKFRLSSVVVCTAVAGYFSGAIATSVFDPLVCSTVTLGTFMAATSANTFNQVIETDLDRLMARTRLRPLPSGRISKTHAMSFGVGSGVASAAMLGVGANPLTAALGVFNIGLYALPYTLSKTKTEANTWIGALVGAIPPLMGWAASGATLSVADPWIMATTLFIWQFPHFFLVAWKYRRDYTMGGYQMVAVNDTPEGTRTANQILVSSLALSMMPLAGIPFDAAVLDPETAIVTGSLVAGNLFANYHFRREKKTSKAQFAWSHMSLPIILALLLYQQYKTKNRRKKQRELEEAAVAEGIVNK